jgi:hypothetical protein
MAPSCKGLLGGDNNPAVPVDYLAIMHGRTGGLWSSQHQQSP